MDVFTGIDSIFYIKYDGLWCPISCEVSSPMSETVEMINTTTRDNAGWKTEKPTLQAYSISIDAVEKKDNYNEIVSYRKVRKFKRDRIKIEWKRETIANYLIDSGFGYVTEISDGNTVGEEITFNFTISGFGKPNENELPDIYSIYSDPITYNFTYSHEPIDGVDSGDEFLTNLLYNNYHNTYGIVYDCDLKIKITGVPAKGFIADNITKQIYTIGDLISYCNKDNLVYFPNGFDNDLGIVGNFTETFSYRIVDQFGRVGKNTIHTLVMTDSAAPEIDLSASISWDDNTSTPKTGNLPNIIVKVVSIIFDPLDPILTQEWQIFDGTDWVFYKTKTTDSETFTLPILENKIRLKVVSSFGEIAYSNNLVYTKSSTSSIFITDIVGGLTGYTTYKLHVEVEAFNGYVVLQGEKNLNGKNANLSDTLGGSLIIPNTKAIGEFVTSAEAITIPVGVYDCVFEANAIPKNSGVTLEVNGLVGYGYTTDIYDSIATAQVNLLIEP